ncbi:MAG: DUF2505 domain-containing protein [Pseudomonadales bacterium]|nr:DUF2505 domain-containing protein [Pseudomonadales bacterium]
MEIKASYFYDIPAQDLINIYHEKEFVKVRCQMPGLHGFELNEFGEKDGKFVIAFRAEVILPIPDKLPRFLLKRIKDKQTYVSFMAWDIEGGDTRRATIKGHMEGLPGEVFGECHVKPTGTGCTNYYSLTASNNIPLVGKKVSALMGNDIKNGLEDEYKATLQYIDEYYDRDSAQSVL